MKDAIYILVIPIVVFAIFILGTIFIVVQVDKYDCDIYAKTTERQTDYQFMTCYVNTGSGYVPKEEFNMRAVTNETKGKI